MAGAVLMGPGNLESTKKAELWGRFRCEAQGILFEQLVPFTYFFAFISPPVAGNSSCAVLTV